MKKLIISIMFLFLFITAINLSFSQEDICTTCINDPASCPPECGGQDPNLQPICGDGIIGIGEECEQDSDCNGNYKCVSCLCVTDSQTQQTNNTSNNSQNNTNLTSSNLTVNNVTQNTTYNTTQNISNQSKINVSLSNRSNETINTTSETKNISEDSKNISKTGIKNPNKKNNLIFYVIIIIISIVILIILIIFIKKLLSKKNDDLNISNDI